MPNGGLVRELRRATCVRCARSPHAGAPPVPPPASFAGATAQEYTAEQLWIEGQRATLVRLPRAPPPIDSSAPPSLDGFFAYSNLFSPAKNNSNALGLGYSAPRSHHPADTKPGPDVDPTQWTQPTRGSGRRRCVKTPAAACPQASRPPSLARHIARSIQHRPSSAFSMLD